MSILVESLGRSNKGLAKDEKGIINNVTIDGKVSFPQNKMLFNLKEFFKLKIVKSWRIHPMPLIDGYTLTRVLVKFF